LTYTWAPSEGLNNPNIAQPTAEITEDRTYTLFVSTPDGCIAIDSVTVYVNPLTVNAGADKTLVCGGSVQFDYPITNYSGSGVLTYTWVPSEGLDNPNIAQPTAEITEDRTYTLFVSTPNSCISEDLVTITVNPLIASVDDVNLSCGNSGQLEVTTNYTGSGVLIYNWSPSTGLSATDISNPVVTIINPAVYSIEVHTPNGCIANENANVSISVIDFIPSICMVTVDENNKNLIVWDSEQNDAIDLFEIYRESSIQTDLYELIGTVFYSEPRVLVDTASNALVQSNKYKISVRDICGYITDKSLEHKTMHLTINKGSGNIWNLIWDPYLGLPVSSYQIYRGTTVSDLTLIGTSSASNTTYTDLTAPAGDVYYQIEVVLPETCSDLKTTEYTSSKSNIGSSVDVVGISSLSPTKAFIYPNPAFDKLYIKNVTSSNATIMIFDMKGIIILNDKLISEQIDISNLSKGIYTVKLIDSGNILINKFVKE
jgi:hypothetical protein